MHAHAQQKIHRSRGIRPAAGTGISRNSRIPRGVPVGISKTTAGGAPRRAVPSGRDLPAGGQSELAAGASPGDGAIANSTHPLREKPVNAQTSTRMCRCKFGPWPLPPSPCQEVVCEQIFTCACSHASFHQGFHLSTLLPRQHGLPFLSRRLARSLLCNQRLGLLDVHVTLRKHLESGPHSWVIPGYGTLGVTGMALNRVYMTTTRTLSGSVLPSKV